MRRAVFFEMLYSRKSFSAFLPHKNTNDIICVDFYPEIVYIVFEVIKHGNKHDSD